MGEISVDHLDEDLHQLGQVRPKAESVPNLGGHNDWIGCSTCPHNSYFGISKMGI